MEELFVLAEHRQGEIRDITFEMLTKGRELASERNLDLVAVLLGHHIEDYAQRLSDWAKRVLLVDDPRLENFNSEAYQKVLSSLISERKPELTLMGHTFFGMDLAPSLATELNIPHASGCMDLNFEGETLAAVRQMYGGKVRVNVSLRESDTYVVTILPAAFRVEEVEPSGGEIVRLESPLSGEVKRKRFISYVQPVAGEVDITEEEILVSVGRGIGNPEDVQIVRDLADALNGELACSRPIVDKGWLPRERQVGQSGRTVKPKLYIACGISGSVQHISGMSSSDIIVAINKDPSAPIFRVADIGIVGDLYEIVPELTKRIRELRR